MFVEMKLNLAKWSDDNQIVLLLKKLCLHTKNTIFLWIFKKNSFKKCILKFYLFDLSQKYHNLPFTWVYKA